jgi:hypothetical protein
MRSHAPRSPIASMITGLRIVNQTAAFMAMGPWVSINFTQAATGSTAARKPSLLLSARRSFVSALFCN